MYVATPSLPAARRVPTETTSEISPMTMRTEMSLNPSLGRRMLRAMRAAKIPAATMNCEVGSEPATASPLNPP